eukprot:8757795-Alexandrium_andersonii.AAC.1
MNKDAEWALHEVLGPALSQFGTPAHYDSSSSDCFNWWLIASTSAIISVGTSLLHVPSSARPARLDRPHGLHVCPTD